MNRSTLLVASLGSALLVSFIPLASAKTTQSRVDYTAALDRASVVYKTARAKCEPMAGHDKDMCIVEAKAGEKRAKASAEQDYLGTIKAKTANQIAHADADYMVAKVACDTAKEKDVCLKQAQATQVKMVADAKAHKTAVDAATDAREDTRDAQYKVALAKCDTLTGTDKDGCVTLAKSAYGK